MSTFLDKIIDAKRRRVEAAKAATDPKKLARRAHESEADKRGFCDVLANGSRINVIAEFKRASPSKGVINDGLDPAETAVAYQNGGAAAISVLTEEDFFRGSLDDLAAVRKAVNLPILRKDFVIDEFQIYESAAAGATAILLIVAALSSEKLQAFQSLALKLGMDVLIEVHGPEELQIAADIGANLIGVNNRNLKTFEVSLDVSRELIEHAPKDTIMVTESGIKTYEDIAELHSLGYKGFLIGETLMQSGNAESTLRKLSANER